MEHTYNTRMAHARCEAWTPTRADTLPALHQVATGLWYVGRHQKNKIATDVELDGGAFLKQAVVLRLAFDVTLAARRYCKHSWRAALVVSLLTSLAHGVVLRFMMAGTPRVVAYKIFGSQAARDPSGLQVPGDPFLFLPARSVGM